MGGGGVVSTRTWRDEILSLIQEAKTSKLKRLDLSCRALSVLPPEIADLTGIVELNLSDNHLRALPPEIGQLTALKALHVNNNRLRSIPAEIGRLISLRTLDLYGNRLASLPHDFAYLVALEKLYLGSNEFTTVPSEVMELRRLLVLHVHANRLKSLPSAIGNLSSLETLALNANQLAALPPEIGGLSALTSLDIRWNYLTSLPPEIAGLSNLHTLELDGNPLTTIPPEIAALGVQAVLDFLIRGAQANEPQWLSKLIVVGEGGTGKTQTLRRLRAEDFDPSVDTTHGVEVIPLELPHPSEPEITMRLNTWDFGGQQIYHATHKFFLTDRSLFLLTWSARTGFEQGNLYYWLDLIRASAPQSPIILVTTHIDQRDPNIPVSELQLKYPQIVAHCPISCLTAESIDSLRLQIQRHSANLPLMGERWPTAWLEAAENVRSRPEDHISAEELMKTLAAHDVVDVGATTLSRWLHDLGDILYFQDAPELRDIVILNPEWVTKRISHVLTSEEVTSEYGILTRAHMDQLWADIDPQMRLHMLSLMEQFDLSYKVPDDLQNRSLVVERVQYEPPDYRSDWDAAADGKQVCMRFMLDSTMPPGVPTYFIARSHRFTTHKHWRHGAFLAQDQDHKHLALIQAFPNERYIDLTVRGPYPPNFFSLLRDGLELTLRRFPGLGITRHIPCPGHDGRRCPHLFDLRHVESALERDRTSLQCPESLRKVSVLKLMAGIPWVPSSTEAGIARVERHCERLLAGQESIKAGQVEQLALSQRNFIGLLRAIQSVDINCPTVFTLRPDESSEWRSKLAGQKMEMRLYCEYPGCWHRVEKGGRYTINHPATWLTSIAPHVRMLTGLLRSGLPVAGAALGVFMPDLDEEAYKHEVALMEKLVAILPEISDDDPTARTGAADAPEQAVGAALRGVYELLKTLDPSRDWGGLSKVLTPEGHCLWLCDAHAAEYCR
jgi:internalin A